MSLNNIKLNPFLIAEMYPDVLVEGTNNNQDQTASPVVDIDSPEEERGEKNWKYLGDYKKKILFIVEYKSAVYIPDEDLDFIATILTACKLSLTDIAIVNLETIPSAVYKQVQEKFKSSVTILFGITPEQFEMPVHFPEFQIQTFNNCTFLHTPAIEEMENDKLLKSKLWVSLKKIFGLQ